MDFPNMSVCSQKRNVGSVWKIGGHTQLTRGNQNIHSSWKNRHLLYHCGFTVFKFYVFGFLLTHIPFYLTLFI